MSLPQSVVVYHQGPAWQQDKTLMQQDHAMGHVRFIRRILADGHSRTAGPFTQLNEKAESEIIGIIVFDLPVDEALLLVADDPAVKHDLLVPSGHRFYQAA